MERCGDQRRADGQRDRDGRVPFGVGRCEERIVPDGRDVEAEVDRHLLDLGEVVAVGPRKVPHVKHDAVEGELARALLEELELRQVSAIERVGERSARARELHRRQRSARRGESPSP